MPSARRRAPSGLSCLMFSLAPAGIRLQPSIHLSGSVCSSARPIMIAARSPSPDESAPLPTSIRGKPMILFGSGHGRLGPARIKPRTATPPTAAARIAVWRVRQTLADCGPARSVARNSAAVRKRSAGTFASALRTVSFSQGGRSGRRTRIEGTGSLRWRARMTWAVFPRNGGSPASISYRRQPGNRHPPVRRHGHHRWPVPD